MYNEKNVWKNSKHCMVIQQEKIRYFNTSVQTVYGEQFNNSKLAYSCLNKISSVFLYLPERLHRYPRVMALQSMRVVSVDSCLSTNAKCQQLEC